MSAEDNLPITLEEGSECLWKVKSESRSVMSDCSQPHGLYSLPGSSVHGALQARILEWGAYPFSRGSS